MARVFGFRTGRNSLAFHRSTSNSARRVREREKEKVMATKTSHRRAARKQRSNLMLQATACSKCGHSILSIECYYSCWPTGRKEAAR
ncbi:hypothetical protein SEA_KRILI_126 [Mycobacterium phage Krili]|nr:hypothetical protein SEA_KRILI_126 [Mycobacterium phage Krili]